MRATELIYNLIAGLFLMFAWLVEEAKRDFSLVLIIYLTVILVRVYVRSQK